jgi:HSP20 family protein
MVFRRKKDKDKDEGPEDRGGREEPRRNIRRNPFGGSFFGGRDPFDDFFTDFSRVEEMMNDLMKDMFSGKGRMEPGKPYVYGFSMKTGPDGKPKISEFGNVKAGEISSGKKKGIGPVVSDAREPLVDVSEREKEIIVIAELPGVSKEDIDLEISGSVLTIRVDTAKKKYYKEVELPAEVKDDATNASYKNGILEVKLKRKKSKKKGKKIQIK